MTRNQAVSYTGIGSLLAIVLSLFFIVQMPFIPGHKEEFSVALLLDLLISIPLVYLFIIWKSSIPKFTVVYVLIMGLIVAGFLMPSDHQYLIQSVKKFLIPTLEIGVLGFVAYRMHALRQSYKLQSDEKMDFFENLKQATSEIFPGKIGQLLATEIAVFYYLLSPHKTIERRPHEYSYSGSGIKLILKVFLVMVVIETIVVHFLLSGWQPILAWVVTAFSIYAGLQGLSILRSMDRRWIVIDHDSRLLKLNYGFAATTAIPFSMIENVTPGSRAKKGTQNLIQLSPFDILESPNLTIYLNAPHQLQKIYGISKEYKAIACHVDQKERFVSELRSIISE